MNRCEMTADFQRALNYAAEQHYRRLMRHAERYVKAWVAATGVHPKEAVLVVQNTPDGFTMKVRKEEP